MPTIVYWRVVEDTVDVPQNVQCFYNIDGVERCDYLCNRANLVDIRRTKDRSDNIVAYSDVVVHNLADAIEFRLGNVDRPDRLEGYNIITLEDDLSDSEKSTIISRSLGFNYEPYVGLNRNRFGRPAANTRQVEETEYDFWLRQRTFEISPANQNYFHLPQDRLRNFAVWADIHNRLMIRPNKIFPTEMVYGAIENINHDILVFSKSIPPWKRKRSTGDDGNIFNNFAFYPLYSASLWEKYWLAIIDENGSIRGKYFKTFDKAESKVKKYILNNFDVDELPDFRYHPLTIVSPNHENVVVKLCKSYEFS